MEKTNIDDEIIHWENKLKHIEWEYSHSMTTDWPKIRERELFFIREIARLNRQKNEKKPATSSPRIINNTIASGEKRDNNNSNNIITTDNNDKNKNTAQSHKDEIVDCGAPAQPCTNHTRKRARSRSETHGKISQHNSRPKIK